MTARFHPTNAQAGRILADIVPETGQARFRAGVRPWKGEGRTVTQRLARLGAPAQFTPKIIKTSLDVYIETNHISPPEAGEIWFSR